MRPRRTRGGMVVLLVAFIVFAAILGALLFDRYGQREMSQPLPARPPEAATFIATLLFAAPDGSGLVREGREVDACGDTTECVEELVGELINGPLGDLTPTLPPNTTVRSVRIEGNVAVVDLGREFVAGVPEGSHAEMMAVYSIVDTIVSNFPQLARVKLLLEGGAFSGLHHLDLNEPLSPDLSLIK